MPALNALKHLELELVLVVQFILSPLYFLNTLHEPGVSVGGILKASPALLGNLIRKWKAVDSISHASLGWVGL